MPRLRVPEQIGAFEFDRACRASDLLRSQVRVDCLGQVLRSLFIGGEPAMSCLFDHLALAAGGNAQVRRAEALAVTDGR